jgi:hypothetical protein
MVVLIIYYELTSTRVKERRKENYQFLSLSAAKQMPCFLYNATPRNPTAYVLY